MSEVKVNIDLDLDTKKAKEQLEDFRDLAKKEDVKVNLKLNDSTDDIVRMKNLLSNAFKLDDQSLLNLEQVENSIKEINRLLASQDNKNISYDIKESDLNNMKEYVRLSQLISRDSTKSSGNQSSANSLNRLERTSNKLEDIQNRLTRIQNARGFLDESLLERTNSLLSETRDKLDADGIESDFKQINQSIRELTNNLQDLTAGNTLSRQEAGFNTSLESMRNRLESFKDSIQGLRGSDDIIERLESSFRSIDSTNIERATVDLRQFGNELNQAQREVRQLESSMERSFFGNFGQEFRDNLFTFTAGELLADGIRNVAQSLKTLVSEYDTAFANLKKVANFEDVMDISQLETIEQKAVQIAKNVGQSSQDVIQAIADTIQMGGYGMEEATLIAEQTMMLANVAEMTQEAASKGIVTMMSAFNLDPLKEIPIIVNGVTKSTDELTDSMDKLNYIGNNYAVSSSGLLDAIQSGANVLAEYNVSMNDTLAMIAGANTTIQNPEKIGNGLKTIAINLSGMKVNAKEGTLELNKTAKALQEIAGIDVYSNKATGEVKDMMQVLDELQVVWKNLREDERLALSEGIAGKQQAAVFASLMSNFDVVKKAQSELNDGFHFGSALAENEQYISSISGKLNTLKETWVGVFNTIFNSESFKSLLDVFISISEVIAKIVTSLDEVGLLTPMLLTLGAALTTKLFGGGLSSALDGVLSSTSRLVGLFPNLLSGFTGFSRIARTTATSTAMVGTAGAAATISLASMTPVLLGIAGAMGVVAVGLKVYDKLNESLDEEKQRLEETISTRKDEISSLEDQKKSLNEIASEYDKLKDKPKKTSEEVERLTELTNELAKIKPELLVGYDENGNAIINMTGDVSDLIKELDEAINRKNRLLKHEQGDLAENSVGQLYGEKYGNDSIISQYQYRKSEMGKLEALTNEHVENISKLESKRDKLISSLYGSTGKERQDIAKQIEDINYQIEKSQSDFNQDYMYQLDTIKEYSDKIGEGLFAGIENSSSFKNATSEKQNHFLELKEVLDFSDIKTEEQLFEVEKALSRFLKVANDGKIDIKGLENSIREINSEFDRTGNLDSYNSSMNELAREISNVTGIDINILNDLFTQFDSSVLNGKDALDEFLRAYGKTKSDLFNDNEFAKALANQKQAIDDWVTSLNEIGYDTEIDLELAYNLISDSDLPEQVRDMVRTLLNQGYDSTKVLDVAQQVLIDLSDGEVDLNSIQNLLDKTFGQGAFEVDADILLNAEAEVAGIDDVVNRLKEKYEEIPNEIETIIRVEGVTSYIEAERILSLYNNFPDEVKTVISSNGYETVKDLELIQQLFTSLPTEQAMQIVTNYSDIIKDSYTLEEVLSGLSKTPLNIEAEVNANAAVNQLNELINTPIKDKILGIKTDNTEANKGIEDTTQKVEGIPNDKEIGVEVDNFSANKRLVTTKNHLEDLKDKTVKVTVNTIEKTTKASVNSGSDISGNTRSFEPVAINSRIDNGNEIALLSDSPVAETVANTSVEKINSRAKNPISAMDGIVYNVDALKKLETQLKKISNELDLIKEKSESAFGQEKIGYLNQQVSLLKKQQDIQHQLAESMRAQANELKGFLTQRGVQISSSGEVLNYSEKILAIEKELKSLNSVDRDNKNEKKIEDLENIKKALEEYINLTTNEIPNASKTWWDLQNAIKDTRSEIVKTELAMKNMDASINVGKYNAALNTIRREINRLDEDIERAFGQEKEDLINKKIELLKKEQAELHNLANSYRDQAKTYKDYLSGKGFKFDDLGNVTNLEQIKNLTNADEFEAIKDILQDYIDLTQNTIPNLSEDWWDLQDAIDDANQAIKDAQKEQLETTKKVQDQIMAMYKKQAEERKKLIDEELNKRLDALSKEQKAYNDARNQQKYEDSYDDQLKKVMELEQQLALLAKDDTLSGQKKYQELLKELQEEQKKLENLVQDKIDEDVNNFYESESI